MTGADVPDDCGEMHVGRQAYLELTPAGVRTTHVRLVHGGTPLRGASVVEAMRVHLPATARRFGDARVVGRPRRYRVIGEPAGARRAGLVVIGDAAGRHDPRGVVGLHSALTGGWRAGSEMGRAAVLGDRARAADDRHTRADRPRPRRSTGAWTILTRPGLAAALGAGAWVAPRMVARLWLRGLQARDGSLPTGSDRPESEAMMGR